MELMKKIAILIIFTSVLFTCKEESKIELTNINEEVEVPSSKIKDSIVAESKDSVEIVIPKTMKQIKQELKTKGFKTVDYVDEETKDTILMQQYFMAFLKKGPIRGQNEEEAIELQKAHVAHLTKMYNLGYADISGPFDGGEKFRGITIYNVPTLKMADSLAKLDPMVKAGRLEIEIHPWWVAKGIALR